MSSLWVYAQTSQVLSSPPSQSPLVWWFVLGLALGCLRGKALQVVSPGFAGLENSEKLLVMHVVVQLGHGQGARVEGDQPNLTIGTSDGKDTSNCIVRSIGFNSNQGTRLILVSKNGRCCEGLLQPIEGMSTVVGEVPRGIFPSKPS